MATDKGTTDKDRTLNNQIRTALEADTSLSDASEKVTLSSDDGVVTLNGTVATEKDKKDLESRVKNMAGVKKVENNLQIGPQASSSTSGSMHPSSPTTTR
jgi:hyperosmotically inducible periplasmic protein